MVAQGKAQGKALVFEGIPDQLKLTEWTLPKLGPGEILVRVLGSTICGSDLHSIHGRRQVPVPTILGHEIVGDIAAFGPDGPGTDWNGETLTLGDRIVWGVVAHCGECTPCQADLPQKCSKSTKYGHEAADPGREWSGGFAEWCILVAGTTIVKIPRDLPIEIACPASCATASVCAGFEAAGAVQNKTVVITGAGLLGVTACAMAAHFGASKIICLDTKKERRETALEFGATEAHAPEEFVDRYGSAMITHVFLELSGAPGAFEAVWPTMAVGGRIVLMGAVFPTASIGLAMEPIIRKMLTIRGVHNYGPRHLARAVKFLGTVRNQYPFAKIVGEWFTLEEYDEALKAAQSGNSIRVGFGGSKGMVAKVAKVGSF